MTEAQALEIRDRYKAELARVTAIWQGNKTAHQAAYDKATANYQSAQTNYMRVTGPGGMTTAEFNAQAGTTAPVAGAPVPTVPAVPSAAPGATGDQKDALAYLRSVIEQMFTDPRDVQNLVDFAWKQILTGASAAEISQGLRETEPFKREYGTVIEGQKKAGLTVSSPAEIRAYRENAAAMFRQAGLPAGFYDQREDFDAYLTGNVSLSELGTRINDGYVRYLQEPAESRAALEQMYGAGAGVAWFLDPGKALPILQRQMAAASISGASTRTGYGKLTTSEAEDLASLGVTSDQAQRGFGALEDSKELFDSLPGENTDRISREEQIGAAFRGNSNAQRRIERRRANRLAAFAGGGGAAATSEGVVGLGASR